MTLFEAVVVVVVIANFVVGVAVFLVAYLFLLILFYLVVVNIYSSLAHEFEFFWWGGVVGCGK